MWIKPRVNTNQQLRLELTFGTLQRPYFNQLSSFCLSDISTMTFETPLIKGQTVLILMLLFSNATTPQSFAVEEPAKISSALMRQERFYQDGVWIARPNPMDLEILSMLQTHQIQTLNDYVQWLEKSTSYKKDTIDIWAKPQETFQRKYGDCEDYAFLNAEVLRLLGYKPHVLALERQSQNHAICAFEDQGRYFWFDNNHLKSASARTLEDLAKTIAEEYSFICLLEYQEKSNDWRILLRPS